MRKLPVVLLVVCSGCAALFGWDIHAPGILSANYYDAVAPYGARVALYLDPSIPDYFSKDRGGALADPQTYHVGEAFTPMLLEGFQDAFSEFVSLETEPSREILKQYGIPYVVYIRIRDFGNRVTMKGQALQIVTDVMVFDQNLNLLERFESRGVSDSKKVFAKKGGPEVNFNAAMEHNIRATVLHLQDALETGSWSKS